MKTTTHSERKPTLIRDYLEFDRVLTQRRCPRPRYVSSGAGPGGATKGCNGHTSDTTCGADGRALRPTRLDCIPRRAWPLLLDNVVLADVYYRCGKPVAHCEANHDTPGKGRVYFRR